MEDDEYHDSQEPAQRPVIINFSQKGFNISTASTDTVITDVSNLSIVYISHSNILTMCYHSPMKTASTLVHINVDV